VIAWWELRRLLYNAIVFVAGMVSIVIIFIAISATDESGDADFTPFLGIFLAATVANFCYTFGWIVELAARAVGYNKSTLGPGLFAVGTLFSILVVSLPAVLWILIWILTLLTSGHLLTNHSLRTKPAVRPFIRGCYVSARVDLAINILQFHPSSWPTVHINYNLVSNK
jgi:hypothetical protein